jgi:rhodanese-related sulfurtransferase
MYILLKWFKNSNLRSTLYRLTILFIFIYVLIRIYKSFETSTLEKPIVIDVRTKTEWDDGHRPEAIHLPYDHINEYTGDKDKKIILYCATCRRANIAKQKLLEMGYTDIRVESYSAP